MSPSSGDYALLSQDSYKSHKVNDTVTLGGLNYQVIAEVDNSRTGYQGTAYRQIGTNEVIIAHRGTEFDREPFHDGSGDAGMVLAGVNDQTPDAMAFTQRVMDYAKNNHPPLNVTVTGHSLGGTLAEIMAYRYGLHGETFNAYGAAGLWQGVPQGGNQIIDHVRAGDVVSAASPQFGEVHVYAATQDIDTLSRAGYRDDSGLLSLRNPVKAIDFDAHSIDNFVPNSELLGQSIMNPESEARYRAHHQMIDRYRNDVLDLRTGLSVGWEAPKAVAKTGYAVGHAVAEEVVDGAHAVEHGARYVADKAEQAYDNTREAVVGGAHAIEHAAHEAYDATRDGIARGVHATGEAVSHGVDAVEHTAHEAGERASGAWDTLTHPSSWFDHKPEATKQAASVQLDHPNHPDHAIYQQAFAGMAKVDASAGRAPNQQTAQVAGSLVPAAVAKGMTRIDEVSLSRDGSRAFAVQNGLSPKLAYVQTDEAVNTSIAESGAAWQEANEQRFAQQQQAAKQQTQQAPEQAQDARTQRQAHLAPSI